MENLLKKIEELRERIGQAKKLLDIDRQAAILVEKKNLMTASDFWQNREEAVKIGQEVEALSKEVSAWDKISQDILELTELTALAEHETDNSMRDDLEKKYLEIAKSFSQMEFLIMFSGKYDYNNAVLSIHAGTGGVDAQDFASILERMYYRFSEQKNFKVEILERSVANEAGIKSVSILVSGPYAYGYLKSENGMHRLVRISPFDAEAMRHTSFALVEVVPEISEASDLEIRDEDIKMEFFHSSGPGGQNVNKTSSAVRIIHLPTKITVSCQTQRSQHQNREQAMKILKSKLRLLEEEKRLDETKKIKGATQTAGWGKQIRSYVMQPYQLVKDHRSNFETADINGVLDGNLTPFMEAYLRYLKK